jgi:hypothetical protein
MSGRLTSLRADGPLTAGVPTGRLPVPDWVLAASGGALALLAALLPGSGVGAVVLAIVLAVALGMASAACARPRGWSWLTPSALRTIEYASIWAAGRAAADADAMPVAFAAIAVIAMHHYDVVYRVRGGQPPLDRRTALALGGWELRTLLVAVAVASGLVTPLLWAMAGWCLLVVVADRGDLLRPGGHP